MNFHLRIALGTALIRYGLCFMLKKPAINSLFIAMSYHEALANVQVQKRHDHCLLLIIIIENELIKVIQRSIKSCYKTLVLITKVTIPKKLPLCSVALAKLLPKKLFMLSFASLPKLMLST